MPEQSKRPEPKQDFKHLIRIAQVDLPGEKPIRIALSGIKGVGFNLASAICNQAGIEQKKKAGNLSEEEIRKLNEIITNPLAKGIPRWMFNWRKDYETGEDKHMLTGELDFVKESAIKRLKKIRCYRGIRHQQGQPVRGQRTKSHFRKNKGKVIGVAKRKEAKSGRP